MGSNTYVWGWACEDRGREWAPKSQRWASEETKKADALGLDIHAPEPGENRFLLCKPPGLGCFAVAVLGNLHGGSVLGWDQGYKKQMLLKPRSCLITRLINLEHDDLNMALNLEKETTLVVFSVDLISPSKAHAFCLQTEREFYYLCVDSFYYFFFNTYCNVSQ